LTSTRNALVNSLKRIANAFGKLVLKVRRLDRETIASFYIKGTGIEIGALHVPLKVPRTAKVSYVDYMKIPDLRKLYPELKSCKFVNVDIVDNGETLETIKDMSQDFVIANHFLEHCENPIGTFGNLVRVLRDGGILYLCLPDKRYTFDKERKVTLFEHLVRDYTKGPSLSRMEHLRDWVVNVDHQSNEAQIKNRINEIVSTKYSFHYHVWTQDEMLEFLTQMKSQFGLPIEVQLFMKNGIECIFIIEKIQTVNKLIT
jgi:predicted SAM-dependent methyltransferase